MGEFNVSQQISRPVLLPTEGISFWGGVTANSGVVKGAHHLLVGTGVEWPYAGRWRYHSARSLLVLDFRTCVIARGTAYRH